MANDLTTMKTRIVSELGNRTDLTQNITDAINEAIAIYQIERFWFNESRTITFPTVIAQEFYTSSDNANIPDLLAIDNVFKIVNNTVTELDYELPDVVEDVSNSGTFTGEPYAYTYYAQQFRLLPVPTAVITIRIMGHVKLAGPTSDVDTSNLWIIEAERLIRSRAKYIIAKHVTLDAEMAATMSPEPGEGEAYLAYCALKGRTNRQTSTGYIAASSF